MAAFFVVEYVIELLAQRFTPLWVRALAGQVLELWLRNLSAGVIGRMRKWHGLKHKVKTLKSVRFPDGRSHREYGLEHQVSKMKYLPWVKACSRRQAGCGRSSRLD